MSDLTKSKTFALPRCFSMGSCLSTDSEGSLEVNKQKTNQMEPGQPVDKIAEVTTSGVSAKGSSKTADLPVRLKNIHATPLAIHKSFKAVSFEKTESVREFLATCLKENFIFTTVPDSELPTLIDAFEPVKFEKGSKIITEGETGDYFYVIEEGHVEFFVAGKNVGDADVGKSFGGLALLYDCPRAATCVAKKDCSLWRVDQNTFRHIQANFAIASDIDTKEVLRKVPFLASLDEDYITRMAYAVTAETYQKDEVIVRKGDAGDKFYVLKDGKVIIKDIEVGGKAFKDQEGEQYFGERALVKDEPRAANVVALEETTVFSITGKLFMELLGDLGDLIIRTNDVRKLKGMKAFAGAVIAETEYKNLTVCIKDVKFSGGDTIFSEGQNVAGAMYIVRSGKVVVTSTKAPTKVLTDGGIFGEQFIHTQYFEAEGTAIVNEDCVLGKLTEKEIYSVLRSRRRLFDPLAKAKSEKMMKMIPYASLKRIRILGVGTFGKVWLCTVPSAPQPKAYALKVQRKRQLLDQKQTDGAFREMSIMAKIDHPFIIKMVGAYQDASTIMILLNLVQGGELFNLMKRSKRGKLGEDAARFYAAGILEGLAHMHHQMILYRDLKPENVLIGGDGFPVIVDLGFAKVVENKTYTLCGTPWYIAPEVILGRGHDKGADYWSLAVMVHEMIIGITPFNEYGTDQMTLFKAIVNGKMKISKMSSQAHDFIKRSLTTKASHRLGNLAGADLDIKTHPYFKTVNYDKIIEKKVQVPWKPALKDATDTSDFDNWDHMSADEKDKPLSAKEQKRFADFEELCVEV